MSNAPPSPLQRLIWTDLEMSGLDPQSDEILEVAMIITDGDLNIIAESESWAVHQSETVLAHMDKWNTRTHTESGLIARCRDTTDTRHDVEKQALAFLKKYVKKKESPMCGNSICQDRRFMARLMPTLEDYFHYRNLDVSSFKIIAQMYMPEFAEEIRRNKPAPHQAMEDIRASIDEMRQYVNAFIPPAAAPGAGRR